MHSSMGFLVIYLVFLGAVMSPGPDFLMVLRNTLGQSARAGVFTALGIVLANCIHMAYCLAGIGLLIAHSLVLFDVIKWIGAAYLVYIGVHAVRSRGMKDETVADIVPRAVKTDRQAVISGFVCNLFNPKATLFFLALFTQMIDPAMPLRARLGMCVIFLVTAFGWFSLVSFVMGVPRVRMIYSRAAKWIDRVFGGFFIALGAKLAFLTLK